MVWIHQSLFLTSTHSTYLGVIRGTCAYDVLCSSQVLMLEDFPTPFYKNGYLFLLQLI